MVTVYGNWPPNSRLAGLAMMVAVAGLFIQVLLWEFVKGGVAARGAEMVDLPLLFRRPIGSCLFYFHVTYGIDCLDNHLSDLVSCSEDWHTETSDFKVHF
jgi:hypothetical protein